MRAPLRDETAPSVARAVAQFALSGLLIVSLIGVGAVLVFGRLARNEAIADARRLTDLAGHGIVQPRLTHALVARQPGAAAALDPVVRRSVLRGSVVRVKIWDADGTILYSDEPRLIGARYPLGEDEAERLRESGVSAELSDLSRPENRFERRYDKLLEVYLPLRAPDGRHVLYEEYLRYDSVTANSRRIWSEFLPVLVGALILLELAQVPLAWSLARRLRQRLREREQLLQQAVEASDRERRRIAGDIHDGLVQELAGLAFEVAAAGERAEGEAGSALRSAAGGLRAAIRQLRSLLVQIYPPTLHEAGLQPALADLLAPAAAKGLDTSLAVDPGLRLDRDAEELLFRGAQEAVRNVLAHAAASAVEVRVEPFDHRVALVVEDDGRGFRADEAARRRGEGHIGLELLRTRAREAGGDLVVDRGALGGTRVRLEVPTP